MFPALSSLRSILLALVCFVPALALGQLAAGDGSSSNQRIATDDLVEVRVFQEDDLTTRARVSREGTIVFPLIGAVELNGRTPGEAGELIRSRLTPRFLKKPQVSVTVIQHAARIFTVLGQVQRPGTFRFPDREGLGLIQAIGMAGGYTRLADPSRVVLKRKSEGREVTLKYDAQRMARDGSVAQVDIQPGDIITIQERLF